MLNPSHLPTEFFQRYPTAEDFEAVYIPWIMATYENDWLRDPFQAISNEKIFDHFIAVHFGGLQ